MGVGEEKSVVDVAMGPVVATVVVLVPAMEFQVRPAPRLVVG